MGYVLHGLDQEMGQETGEDGTAEVVPVLLVSVAEPVGVETPDR
jgi:hypothetical protein